MKLIGLTGGIATGKSTVSKMLRDLGLTVIDADVLAREVVEPGSFGLRALVQVFGFEILKNSGGVSELDRGLLSRKLFDDVNCRRVVENITHPLIQWRASQEFRKHFNLGENIIFYDAALIFEKNLRDKFNSILVVHTTPEIQIQRLKEREKIDHTHAKKRISSQIPISEKISGANHLIDNNGNLSQTKEQVIELIKKLQEVPGSFSGSDASRK